MYQLMAILWGPRLYDLMICNLKFKSLKITGTVSSPVIFTLKLDACKIRLQVKEKKYPRHIKLCFFLHQDYYFAFFALKNK